MKEKWSQAEKLGMFSFGCALLLLFVSVKLALLVLILFLCCCMIAPFVPGWGFFQKVINKGSSTCAGVVLSFDDGPSPETTPMILDLLDRYGYKAIFFVIGEKAEKYPELIDAIVKKGHDIGNHSWKHDSFLMLRSRQSLLQDLAKTQQLLESYGIQPRFFRPPAGITNPRLRAVLVKLNLQLLTFSCRGYDGGNKKISNLSKRLLKKIAPGDIILLHDSPPQGQNRVADLHKELEMFFVGLNRRGYAALCVDSLIQHD